VFSPLLDLRNEERVKKLVENPLCARIAGVREAFIDLQTLNRKPNQRNLSRKVKVLIVFFYKRQRISTSSVEEIRKICFYFFTTYLFWG
jgi:hypothetical protein